MHYAPIRAVFHSYTRPSKASKILLYTQRVRSWSEDRRARPEGGSSSSVAPTTTAGSLSATADGPPEADPIARRRCAATKRSTTLRLTLCGPPLRILDRFPHPSNYFRLTNSTSGRGRAPQTERRSTPLHDVQRFRHSAVVFAHLPGISHFLSPKWRLIPVPVLTRNFDFSHPVSC